MNKLPASKLFKLKEWLTLPDTAKHLTNIFGEDVTVADILRLALDNYLTLSVHFVNRATGKACQMVHRDENTLKAQRDLYLTYTSLFDKLNFHEMNPGISIGKGNFLIVEKECTQLIGTWDLPLIGGDRISIETKYQELIGGAENEMMSLDGAFVGNSDSGIYQLQESFDNDEYGHQTSIMAQTSKLRRLEFSYSNNIRKEKLLILRKDKLETLKKEADEWKRYGRYYPSCELPMDSDVVVRTAALREFEERITESTIDPTHNKADRPLTTRQRKTCLTIIAALCLSAKIDPEARGASQRIKELTESLGVPVDDETIRTLLSEIPDALEARMK